MAGHEFLPATVLRLQIPSPDSSSRVCFRHPSLLQLEGFESMRQQAGGPVSPSVSPSYIRVGCILVSRPESVTVSDARRPLPGGAQASN